MIHARSFQCIGHRGAAGHAPENTLLAIRKALQLGAGAIEVDVHYVHGRLVVIHDRSLNRTTSGTGRLTMRSLAYIRAVNAGKDQKVPFLEEVFEEAGSRAGLHLEIKGHETAAALGHFIRRKTREGWETGRIVVSSFDHAQLRIMKRHFPEIQIGVLYRFPQKGFTQRALGMKAFSVHLPWQLTRKQMLVEAAEAGLKCYIYTVNRRTAIRRFIVWGADGIFSDYPERVRDEYNRITIAAG